MATVLCTEMEEAKGRNVTNVPVQEGKGLMVIQLKLYICCLCRCLTCNGTGTVTCTTCAGKGALKCYILLIVTW